ncbi:MAG: hypothetical protein HOF76_05030 [Candidatus Scalindua sp.]|nr:hypothetical protein [Candidatus Scalindua sp.]
MTQDNISDNLNNCKSARLNKLFSTQNHIAREILLKISLLFSGIRFTPELEEAGKWALPNYQPYRFNKEERLERDVDSVDIPYLMFLGKLLIRVKISSNSPYSVIRKNDDYILYCDDTPVREVEFQRKPDWYTTKIQDGTPIPMLGLSQHGDMLIVNASPGCEYFLHQDESSGNYRCRFCFYGAPNPKMPTLGRPETLIKEEDLLRLAEAVSIASKEINHIYLVAGSMADINQEAERYIQVASAITKAVDDRVNICCGSSALPKDASLELKKHGVGAVCFNLEIWDEELWDKICPGKSKFVGRENWIQGLTDAVDVFGRGNVMSAFVSGIEIMQPYGYTTPEALKSSLEGAEFLLQKGVMSLFTLYWPRDASEFEEKSDIIHDYFLELSNEYHKLRKQYDLNIPNKFVCQNCSYMQLDCDFDYFM